ncbi:uncharacterized protein [Prorops nasuta]|uniref:uncharacterized protein isoform X1 n=1 Tax=Prorops nasuta TaxID=863751 RepID=UPI0034CF401E
MTINSISPSFSRYLYCIRYKELNCKANGRFYNNEFHPSDILHNHEPNIINNKKSVFYKKMKESAKINGTKPKQIYNFVVMNNQEIEAETSFTTCRRTLQRYIKKISDKSNIILKENNLNNLAKYITKEQTNSDKIKLNTKVLRNDATNILNIVFYDFNFIQSILQSAESMFIDGTFKAIPNLKDKNIQLLTILISINEYPNKAIPCFWILMKNRRTLDYLETFEYLKHDFTTLKPKLIMLDYEQAMSNAIQIAYPSVEITHCFFHFSQALIKKAQKLKIISKTKNKLLYPERFLIIRKLTLLALLPPAYVRGVFQQLKKDIQSQFGMFFEKYLKYYENFWINEVEPHKFSVFKLINRTNNYSESYNRKLHANLGKKPNINSFISEYIQYFINYQNVERFKKAYLFSVFKLCFVKK